MQKNVVEKEDTVTRLKKLEKKLRDYAIPSRYKIELQNIIEELENGN